MFTEASVGSSGNVARLRSPLVNISGAHCLSISYHMYGEHIGTFTVFKQLPGGSSFFRMARISGNNGNAWKEARMDVDDSNGTFYLVLEAKRHLGYKGDQAIDDITLTKGECDLPGLV